MGITRETRGSEKTLNSIISSIRNLDKLLWYFDVRYKQNIEEEIGFIKNRLDLLYNQYCIELETENPSSTPTPIVPDEVIKEWNKAKPEPFTDPVHKSSEWQLTPLIDKNDF